MPGAICLKLNEKEKLKSDWRKRQLGAGKD